MKMTYRYTNSGSTYIILEHRIMLKLYLDTSEKLSMFPSKGGKMPTTKTSSPHSCFVASFNISKVKIKFGSLICCKSSVGHTHSLSLQRVNDDDRCD